MNNAPDPKPVTMTAHAVTVYHEVPVRSSFCRACTNADNHETCYARDVDMSLTLANYDFLNEVVEADLPGLISLEMTEFTYTFVSYRINRMIEPMPLNCELFHTGDFEPFRADYRGHPLSQLSCWSENSVFRVTNSNPVQNWCSPECEGERAEWSGTDRPVRKFDFSFATDSDAHAFRVWLSDSDHYETQFWCWLPQEGEWC